MTRFPWDGLSTHLLLDKNGYIVGVLLGMPRDVKGWKEAQGMAFVALDKAADVICPRAKEASHRRGEFPSLPHGISFGGGQPEPQFLTHSSDAITVALEELATNKGIQRMCNYASCGYQLYGERNFEHMRATIEAIKTRYDDHPNELKRLRREYNDQMGAYPCRSYNVGKKSVTFPHTDNGNLSHSWCSVTPLGSFNHQTGGHLVLWDFGLVIDFPAGATILIPSSVILHSNTTIKDDETRYAIVQYVSGGLFRWVENGYSTQDDSKQGPEPRTDGGRWASAVKMFTNIAELVEGGV
ncbi:hypothetical protein F5887DRAFT_1213628 [Amanita rubescens]|nr:hypothetical protein F5887DRAFT_1213628 [Amanita rubescens]